MANLIQFLSDGVVFDGEPLASGTATVYTTGTTDVVTVYSDMDETGTLTNPVTLGTQGEVNAYIRDIVDVLVKDSDGNTKYTINEFNPMTDSVPANLTTSANVDIYVDIAASDDNDDGLTSGTPKKYLQSGLELAQKLYTSGSYCTIHVEAGTYGSSSDKDWEIRGIKSLNAGVFSSTSAAIILAAENGTVVCDGASHTSSLSHVFKVSNSNVALTGNWTFQNPTPSGTSKVGLFVDDYTSITSSGVLTCNSNTSNGFRVLDHSTCSFGDIVCSSNTGAGISCLSRSQLTLFGDVTCNSNSSNGINISDLSELFFINAVSSSLNVIQISSNTSNGINIEDNSVCKVDMGVVGEIYLDISSNSSDAIIAKEGSIFSCIPTNVSPGNSKIGFNMDSNNMALQALDSGTIIISSEDAIVMDIDSCTGQSIVSSQRSSIEIEVDYSSMTVNSVTLNSRVVNGSGININCLETSRVRMIGFQDINSNADSSVNMQARFNSQITLSTSSGSEITDMQQATRTTHDIFCDSSSNIRLFNADLIYHDVSGYIFSVTFLSLMEAGSGVTLNNGTTTDRISANGNSVFSALGSITDNGSGVDSSGTGAQIIT